MLYPADVPVVVLFARTHSDALNLVESEGLTGPCVVVLPDFNTWNDHSFQLFAKLEIVEDGKVLVERPNRLMFEGATSTAPKLLELFAQYGRAFAAEKIEDVFVSLLNEAEDYDLVVKTLGFDRALSALRKMGDAVVVALEGRDQARLRLTESRYFNVGVMRHDVTYHAWRRGGRYLRPDPAPVYEDAAVSFCMAARLPGAANPYVLKFDFSEDRLFRDRVAVLIGGNGSGKTQLLRSLIERQTYRGDGPRRCATLLPRPRATRVLMFSSVPSDPYRKVIPPWEGIDYAYFGMTAQQEMGRDALLQALADCLRADATLRFDTEQGKLDRLDLLYLVLGKLAFVGGLHVPLRPPEEGHDEFTNAVDHEGQLYLLLTPTLGSDYRKLSLLARLDWSRTAMIFGLDGRPRHLSSGEQAMFRFAAQAVSAIEPASLLLLDEPETHLHPNFVSDLMELLQTLLDATRSVAIIATHSAYIVREVPRQRVRILALEERQIRIQTPRIQTFGATIDSISEFVFGDHRLQHRFQTTLKDWVEATGRTLGLDEIIKQYGPDLNATTLSYIAELLRSEGERSA